MPRLLPLNWCQACLSCSPPQSTSLTRQPLPTLPPWRPVRMMHTDGGVPRAQSKRQRRAAPDSSCEVFAGNEAVRWLQAHMRDAPEENAVLLAQRLIRFVLECVKGAWFLPPLGRVLTFQATCLNGKGNG